MVAEVPLSVEDLLKLFPVADRPKREEVTKVLESLAQDSEKSSYSLVKVASGWRYQIDQDFAEVIGRLHEHHPPRYSQALLETLAVIAYQQPVTRGDIQWVRSVEPSTHIMQTLLERGWVRVVGHKKSPGTPALYGTTREFLDYFGLKSLKELPELPEVSQDPTLDGLLPAVASEDDEGEETRSSQEASDTPPTEEEPPSASEPPSEPPASGSHRD